MLLAKEITARFHGAAAAEAAEADFDAARPRRRARRHRRASRSPARRWHRRPAQAGRPGAVDQRGDAPGRRRRRAHRRRRRRPTGPEARRRHLVVQVGKRKFARVTLALTPGAPDAGQHAAPAVGRGGGGDDRAEDRRRGGSPAPSACCPMRSNRSSTWLGAVRAGDGDDRRAAGRRRPSLRPHKAEYFSSALRGRADRRRGAGHRLGGGAAAAWTRSRCRRVGLGLALTVVSSVLNGAAGAGKMMAASREHRSIALEADARHLYTDVWTSAGVVVGLVARAA